MIGWSADELSRHALLKLDVVEAAEKDRGGTALSTGRRLPYGAFSSGSALVTFDEAVAAQDDVAIQGLGGLQLGLIRAALEAADAETLSKDGGISVRLR